jgi:deazaflavin-dependent oxidoreductase (nitroreductase family)
MENHQQSSKHFMQPTAIDRIFNRLFGFIVRIGLGLKHNYMLEVQGRKTGRTYSTPVNILEQNGIRYIVAPRGYTQWVRNVLSSGDAHLVKGRSRERIRLQAIADNEKPEILKAYLDRYKRTVQRYFPVRAGSSVEAFEPIAEKYPVFRVTAAGPIA